MHTDEMIAKLLWSPVVEGVSAWCSPRGSVMQGVLASNLSEGAREAAEKLASDPECETVLKEIMVRAIGSYLWSLASTTDERRVEEHGSLMLGIVPPGRSAIVPSEGSVKEYLMGILVDHGVEP